MSKYSIEYSTIRTCGIVQKKFKTIEEAIRFFLKIRAKALYLAVYDVEDGVYLNW